MGDKQSSIASSALKYTTLLAFFLPISLATLLKPVTDTMLNAGIARMAEPEVSLAAFAVAKSIIFSLQGPLFTIRSIVASLVVGEKSYTVVSRFFILLTLILTLIITFIAYTSLSQMFLEVVIGVKGNVLTSSMVALKIFCLLPLITGIAYFYHGIAVLLRCQRFMLNAAGIRAILMVLILFATSHFHIHGAIFGSAVFVISTAIETVIFLVLLKSSKGSIKGAIVSRMKEEEHRDVLDINETLRFSLPYMMSVTFFYAIRPVLNIGLARSSLNPEIYLAGFEVGYSIIAAIGGPTDVLHQCSLVYWNPNDKQSQSILKRFFIGITLFFAGLLCMFGFTPVGEWILIRFMNITESILPTTLGVIRVGTLFIVVRAFREYYWGILMRTRQTNLIAVSRIMNMMVTLPSLLFIPQTLPINPGVASCALWVVGEALEGAYIYLLSRNKGVYYDASIM